MAPVAIAGGGAAALAGAAIPVIAIGGAVAAGVVLAGAAVPIIVVGRVAKAVQNLVDQRVAIAEKAAEEERAKIAEWQVWQERQRQQSASLAKAQAALLETQGRLLSVGLAVGRADQAGQASTAKGYVSLKAKQNAASRQESTTCIQSIARILNEVPADLRMDTDSPLQKLLAQAERLTQRLTTANPPLPDELTSFQEAVTLTITGYMEAVRKKQEATEAMSARLDTLLQAIGRCRQFASAPERQAALDSLQAQALALLAKQSIPAGQVELLEKRLAVIGTALEAQITQSAFRTTLAAALDNHLLAMGFATNTPFPTVADQSVLTAVMNTPAGIRLQIAIQADNRLAFEVLPKDAADKRKLTANDRESFRTQEKNWCQKEMPELLRRLTQDGFSYEVQLARDLPESRLQIAVVEDVDEILASQAKVAIQKNNPVTTAQPDTHAEEVRRHQLQQPKRGERH
jgi:hypothetical protein